MIAVHPDAFESAAVRDPSVSPAWRWQRASFLVKHRHRIKGRLDQATRRVVHFLSGKVDPILAEAREIHERNDWSRWRIEANLLTGDPIEGIAKKLNLDLELVDIYGQVYFDVTGHLEAKAWIATFAIGGALIRRDLHKWDTATILKSVAWQFGSLMLHLVDAEISGEGQEDYSAEEMEWARNFVEIKKLDPLKDQDKIMHLYGRMRSDWERAHPAAAETAKDKKPNTSSESSYDLFASQVGERNRPSHNTEAA